MFFPADANTFDTNACQTALAKLESVASISCVRENVNKETHAGTYLVTIQSYPVMPFMNNIVFHNGNPARNLFHCNTSLVDEEDALGPYCRVSDVEPSAELPGKLWYHQCLFLLIPLVPFSVYSECSSHGICDRVYGKCACERGFKGDACDDMRDAEDIVKHTHDGPFFTGSLLRLDMDREPSEVFALFSARLKGQNVTTITGDSRLVHEGEAVVRGGLALGETNHTEQSNVS